MSEAPAVSINSKAFNLQKAKRLNKTITEPANTKLIV